MNSEQKNIEEMLTDFVNQLSKKLEKEEIMRVFDFNEHPFIELDILKDNAEMLYPFFKEYQQKSSELIKSKQKIFGRFAPISSREMDSLMDGIVEGSEFEGEQEAILEAFFDFVYGALRQRQFNFYQSDRIIEDMFFKGFK